MSELLDRANVDRLVVLNNPVAKNGHRGMRQFDELRQTGLFADYEFVDTSEDPEQTAIDLEDLRSTDLLFVIGGDGTINSAIAPLQRSGALLLPTRSGNACDMAKGLYGRRKPSELVSILGDGRAYRASVMPIEVRVEDVYGERLGDKLALNYVSFGFAALASDYLNMPWEHPNMKKYFDQLPPKVKNIVRFVRDGVQLAKAASDIQPFDYNLVEDNGLNRTRAVDVSVVRSPRMAKLGRFSINHTDSYMLYSALAKKGVMPMANQYVKMMRGKMDVEAIESLECFIEATSEQRVMCQTDGEAFALPESSWIKIGFSDHPVSVLTLK